MLRTEGNGHRHTPSVQHSCGAPEGARSRKPRPVLCLGNRALNGRPTGDAEVGVARCLVTERLVGSDAVVDVAEAAVSIASAPPSSMGAPPIDRLRRDAVPAGGLGNRDSPDITASTICSRVSTGTGSLDLLKIVSPVRSRPETLPVILRH